jgi:integrase
MAIALKFGTVHGAEQLLHSPRACTVAAEGQRVNERKEKSLARRRFQQGQLKREERHDEAGRIDKDRSVWLGRWREDELRDGGVHRVRRTCVLGTLRELPTEKLAAKELRDRIDRAAVNSATYRPRVASTFGDLANRWESTVLGQLKPSTQVNFRSHLKKYIRPYFGVMPLREITTEAVQQFVAGIHTSPKTVRNVIATFRVVWGSVQAWTHVDHDPFEKLRLAKSSHSRQFCFTIEEARRIITAAQEPYRTFYWLALETGMRAGELCALRVDDLDLEACIVHVNQSAWGGRLHDPKSASGIRGIGISPQLAAHLKMWLTTWRPNERRLLFATRTGTPWDHNLVRKRQFRKLLAELKIEVPRGGGFHAFRRLNATLLDRLQAPVKIRQERLGHSDPKVTLNTYTHIASEDEKRIAEEMGGILDLRLDLDNAENKKAGVGEHPNSSYIN